VLDAGPDVLAWRRQDGDDRVLTAVNFAAASTSFALDGPATLLLSTDPDRALGPVAGGGLELAPSEGVLLRLL